VICTLSVSVSVLVCVYVLVCIVIEREVALVETRMYSEAGAPIEFVRWLIQPPSAYRAQADPRLRSTAPPARTERSSRHTYTRSRANQSVSQCHSLADARERERERASTHQMSEHVWMAIINNTSNVLPVCRAIRQSQGRGQWAVPFAAQASELSYQDGDQQRADQRADKDEARYDAVGIEHRLELLDRSGEEEGPARRDEHTRQSIK